MIDELKLDEHPILCRVPRHKLRVYRRSEVCAFWFTSAEFGEFSNMADGFPVEVADVEFRSIEALYQACRFPSFPDVQREIAEAPFAKRAKLISRANTARTRSDWLQVRTAVMRWALKVKAMNYKKDFVFTLVQTGSQSVVEESTRDPFWGALKVDDYLVGINVLGRLLMELREGARANAINLMQVEPPMVPDFFLFGSPVGATAPSRR